MVSILIIPSEGLPSCVQSTGWRLFWFRADTCQLLSSISRLRNPYLSLNSRQNFDRCACFNTFGQSCGVMVLFLYKISNPSGHSSKKCFTKSWEDVNYYSNEVTKQWRSSQTMLYILQWGMTTSKSPSLTQKACQCCRFYTEPSK